MGSRSIFSPNRDFVVIPTILNLLLAIVVYALFVGTLGTEDHQPPDEVFCLVFVACSFVVSVWTFRSYFDEDVSDGLAWIAIFANAIVLIVIFASIHFGVGIVFAGSETLSEPQKAVDFRDAIYFSIVTFTTLGYGDFQPSHDLRLVTGIQAILGYFYLGFFVASAHHYSTHFMDFPDDTSGGENGGAALVGPQGEKGEAGLMGPRGERGEKGEAGERGDRGEAGPKGDTGPVGPRGEKGEAGSTGPRGERGEKGETGPRGEKGEAGPKGDIGPVGPRGQRGETGPTGARGEKGDSSAS